MKALTVKQPWAHMIAHCGKDVENRSWPVPGDPVLVNHVGELAIHAGARSGWDEDGEFGPLAQDAWKHQGYLAAHLARDSEWITFSAIVAVAEGVVCHHATDCAGPALVGDVLCSPWAAWGQFHWSWKALRVLASPVPCRGHQKLWTVPEDIESAVRAQLGETDA
jgi:hypothetical protein